MSDYTTSTLHKNIIRRLSKTSHLLLLGILPLLLLVVDNSWIFTPIGHADPWIYFGYFLNFPQHLQIFSDTYFSTRLSLTLPGVLAYAHFPPVIANYVLHLSIYYIALFSFYFIVKRLCNDRIALLTSISLGCYTFFLHSVGWNYSDSVGLAYLLITLCLLTYASSAQSRRVWMFGVGIVFAALIYSNIFWLNMSPLLAIYYLHRNRNALRYRLRSDWLMVLVGFFTLTIIFGIISAQTNGNFLFFASSIRFSRITLAQPNQWIVPWDYWLPRAYWLVVPAIALFGATLILLKRSGIAESQPSVRLLQLLLIGMWLIYGFWQVVLRQPVLQFTYYASYLIPFTFLALGGQFYYAAYDAVEQHLKMLTVLLLGAYLIPPVVGKLLIEPSTLDVSAVPPLVLGVVIIGLFILKRQRVTLIAVTLISLGLSNYISRNYAIVVRIADSNEISFTAGHADEHLVLYDAVRAIQKYSPKGNVIFWYNSRISQYNSALYASVASTYLWWANYIKSDFPIFNDPLITLQSGTVIAVLSTNDDTAETAQQVLGEHGFKSAFIATEHIQHGMVGLTMTFVEII